MPPRKAPGQARPDNVAMMAAFTSSSPPFYPRPADGSHPPPTSGPSRLQRSNSQTSSSASTNDWISTPPPHSGASNTQSQPRQSSSQRPQRIRRAPARVTIDFEDDEGEGTASSSSVMRRDEESEGSDFDPEEADGEDDQDDDVDEEDADEDDPEDEDDDSRVATREPDDDDDDPVIGSAPRLIPRASAAAKSPKKAKKQKQRASISRPRKPKILRASGDASDGAYGRYRPYIIDRTIGSSARASNGMNLTREEQRPLFFPFSMGGQLLRVPDPMLSLSDVGKEKVRLDTINEQDRQVDFSDESIHAWQHVTHWALLGRWKEHNKSLVADWGWDAGKGFVYEDENDDKELVREAWKEKAVGDAQMADGDHRTMLESARGVMLLGLESKEKGWRFVDSTQAHRYVPPPADPLPAVPTDAIKTVGDLVERPPLVNNARGDYSLALNLDEGDDVEVKRESSTSLESFGLGASGFVYNAGSFISSLDWAPASHISSPHPEYLALAVSLTSPPGAVPQHALGERSDAPGAIHILCLSHGECRLEYKIAIKEAEVRQVLWSPRGWDHREPPEVDQSGYAAAGPPPRIGLLAVILSNRKVTILAPPHPDVIHNSAGKGNGNNRGERSAPLIELTPLLELPFHGASRQPTCIAWGSGELLAAGCVDGSVSVWPVGEHLRSIGMTWPSPSILAWERSPPPFHHIHPVEGTVTSLSFLNLPRRSATGRDLLTYSDTASSKLRDGGVEGFEQDSAPHILLVSSLDGTQQIVDLDAPELLCGEATRLREPLYTSSFMPAFLGCWLVERGGGENAVRLMNPRPDNYGRSHGLTSHRGRVTALSGSRYHPLVASGAADGSVKVTNALLSVSRTAKMVDGMLFRLDIHRSSGKLRFVDRVLPEDLADTAKKEENGEGDDDDDGDGQKSLSQLNLLSQNSAWHPAVRVTGLAWSPNVQTPFLLASATAAGLVRIDWLAATQMLARKGKGGKKRVRPETDEEGEEGEEGGGEEEDANGPGENDGRAE